MTETAAEGHIVTFYSYKGGTGRSMALANVAWILASNGKRVLAVDWDIEAPGLHRYFHPFLRDKNLTSTEGLMDFVVDYASEALTPPLGETTPKDWYVQHADICRYAESLRWPLFPNPGTLDFIPAGRQSESYATTVNFFNWKHFYEELGGGAFFDAAKTHMRRDYDYILIDSRTGVSDTSGICTVQMPETVVLCFTLNIQSIEGAAAVAESIQKQQAATGREVRILPVPTRVDRSEKEKVDLARIEAWRKFDPFLWQLSEQERADYWAAVEVPYEAWYSFEEVLSPFGDRTRQQASMLSVMETITSYVSAGAVTRHQPVTEPERLRGLNKFLRRATPSEASRVDDAVTRGERAMARLSTTQQKDALDVILRLASVEPSGDVMAAPPLERRHLGDVSDRVMQALEYARIITVTRTEEGPQFVQLSSNDIFRDWTPAKRAVEEDRPYLVWRQQIASAATAHERTHDPSLLLRGNVLREARDRLARRSTDLNDSEQRIIHASIRRRRNVAVTVAAAVILPVLVALAWIAYSSSDRYQLESVIAAAPVLIDDNSTAATNARANWVRALVVAGREDEARKASDSGSSARRAILLASLAEAFTDRGLKPQAAAARSSATAVLDEVSRPAERVGALISVAHALRTEDRETAFNLLVEAQSLISKPDYGDLAASSEPAPFQLVSKDDFTSAERSVDAQQERLQLVADLIRAQQDLGLEDRANQTFEQAVTILAGVSPRARARWLLDLAGSVKRPTSTLIVESAQGEALHGVMGMPQGPERKREMLDTIALILRAQEASAYTLVLNVLKELTVTPEETFAGTQLVLSLLGAGPIVGATDQWSQDVQTIVERLPLPFSIELQSDLAAALTRSDDTPALRELTARLESVEADAATGARIQASLSEAYWRLGNRVRSTKSLDRAMQLAKAIPDLAAQSEAYMKIAIVAAHRGDASFSASVSDRARDEETRLARVVEVVEAIGDSAASSDERTAGLQTKLAVDVARKVEVGPVRDRALVTLVATLISGAKLEAAIDAARPIGGDAAMREAISRISSVAGESRLLLALQPLADSIGDRELKTRALIDVAARQIENRATPAVISAAARAVERQAEGIADSAARSHALLYVASLYVAADDLRSARRVAFACDDARDRLEAFAEIVSHFGATAVLPSVPT